MKSLILGVEKQSHLVTCWDDLHLLINIGDSCSDLCGYVDYSIELDEENEHGHIMYASVANLKFCGVTPYLSVLPCFDSAGHECFPGED